MGEHKAFFFSPEDLSSDEDSDPTYFPQVESDPESHPVRDLHQKSKVLHSAKMLASPALLLLGHGIEQKVNQRLPEKSVKQLLLACLQPQKEMMVQKREIMHPKKSERG